MLRPVSLIGAASLLAVSACAVAPTGPSVMALPPQGKTFDQFQAEDAGCRNYASQMSGGANAQIAANNAGVGSALVGTALGAGLGAAIGAAAGAPGAGAAVGAAAGLLTGTAVGAGNVQAAGYGAQVSYDMGYTQCMYAYGNSVQTAPGGYATGYPYGAPGFAYAAPPIIAAPIVTAPIVVGGGWGWGGGGWRGGGWNGGGWHGGGWRGGGGGWYR